MFCVSHHWTGRPSSAPLPLLARWALKQKADSAIMTVRGVLMVCGLGELPTCGPGAPITPGVPEVPCQTRRQITSQHYTANVTGL